MNALFWNQNSWFRSHTTQVILIYKLFWQLRHFSPCPPSWNSLECFSFIKYTYIYVHYIYIHYIYISFHTLSECSLTLETLFWNQKLSIYLFYKSSYFITNLVMATLAPYYFRFSSFLDCPPKIFIFSLFFQKFWYMTKYASEKFFTKYNISTDKNIAILFIISIKLYFQFLNLCAHISTRTFQNIKFEL